MNKFEFKILQGLSEFQDVIDPWNELFETCGSRNVHACHRLVSAFVERFANSQVFTVACAFDGDQLVAGLPLFYAQKMGVFSSLTTLANPWVANPGVLFSPNHDPNAIVDCLIDGFDTLDSPALKLDWIPDDHPAYAAFFNWGQANGASQSQVERHTVGKTILADHWDQFTADWSKSRRKFIRKSEQKLSDLGTVSLVCIHDLDRSEVNAYFDRSLAIELSGWKGAEGTSIQQDQAAEGYYRDMIDVLHPQKRLRFFGLELDDELIAFDFGFYKDRVASSVKISYSPKFTECSPGHVLNALVIRHMIAAKDTDWVDTVGAITPATARWCEDSFRCMQLDFGYKTWLNRGRVQFMDFARTIKSVAKSFRSAQS